MGEREKLEGMLGPYRVLDLTDEKGLLCGKLLGDLGADVIKIERPGGDPARNIGPFYHNEVNPEKSLFWWAFNTSKRGITLDIETTDGRETFRKLAKGADFIIESFPPGYMGRLGLGYSALEKISPGIIMVSITPFGQTGPYKDYRAPDIVAWAMGGHMYPCGDADRPPVQISHHSQAYLHAGAEAAVGAMMALYHREMTGEGQQVDVSIQDCLAQVAYATTSAWDMMGLVRQREIGMLAGMNVRMTRMWPCKDGHILWFFSAGVAGMRGNVPLVEWMDEEGMADAFLKGFDWSTLEYQTATQETLDRLEEPVGKFFLSHTKAELMEGAFKRNAMLYPISTVADILDSVQLAAREFWVGVEHPELGVTITYPGAFTRSTEAPPGISCRAPLIGEHNREVYKKELTLKQATVYPAKLDKMSQRGKPEEKLLEGINVVDFGWAITVPVTTRTLADYGAEVVKIESVSHPDSIRTSGPFKDGVSGVNRSGTFNQDNTGKLSVTLNLAHTRGVEIARRFVARADVVVENFAGGVMERLGLGYEELKKVKPDIIMLSSCMQGQTGPHATHHGFGWHLTALSGFFEITGWPDREPTPPDGPYTDFVAPRFNTLAILAALDYRHRTGKGQYLDVSAYENGVHFIAPLVLDYNVNRRVAKRTGNRSLYAAPHGAYRCRGEDKWCVIAVLTEEEWRSFCKVIGNPAWTSDPKFSTLLARKENEDELDRLVEGWTIIHPPGEVMTMMQTAGVGAGVVETGEDQLEHDPQLKHRRSFRELDHPEIGKYYAPGPSFVLSKSPCEVRRAPLLGEHNEYALKELLGMSDEEIAELIIEGVVE